jgi:hypothetical protein
MTAFDGKTEQLNYSSFKTVITYNVTYLIKKTNMTYFESVALVYTMSKYADNLLCTPSKKRIPSYTHNKLECLEGTSKISKNVLRHSDKPRTLLIAGFHTPRYLKLAIFNHLVQHTCDNCHSKLLKQSLHWL